MAINVYQAYAGQAIRPTSVGESPARRGQSADTTPAVSQVEAPKGEQVAQTLGGMGPENGLEAVLRLQWIQRSSRERWNKRTLRPSALRADRSVQFGLRRARAAGDDDHSRETQWRRGDPSNTSHGVSRHGRPPQRFWGRRRASKRHRARLRRMNLLPTTDSLCWWWAIIQSHMQIMPVVLNNEGQLFFSKKIQ